MDEPGSFAQFMSDSDALMWNIEKDPVLRTTITAVALLDRAPDWEVLRQRVLDVTRVVPRLRQKVVVPPLRLGPPLWVDDPAFDLDYHLRRVAAPDPATFAAVLELARVAGMEGFDRARPLWQFTLVEGLADGQAALVQKIHHTFADGVGSIRLYLELLDSERHPARTPVPDGEERPLDAPDGNEVVRRALLRRRDRWTELAASAPMAAARLGFRFARDPVGSAMAARRSIRSAGRLLAPVPEPLSPVMTDRSLNWHLDAFELPLDDLRRAAKAAGGSINDAFLAAVAGGLVRYHAEHGAEVEELRVDVPVSIRMGTDPLGGNRFVPVRVVLPVGLYDPVERMQEIGRIVRAGREEPAMQMVDGLAAVLNRLPTTLVTAVFGSMLKHVDFTASNVPGIPVTSYLAGAELVRQFAFAPPSGTALNVTLLSHVGTACIGVNSDTGAVPDPEVLTACLRAGFDDVVAAGLEGGRKA